MPPIRSFVLISCALAALVSACASDDASLGPPPGEILGEVGTVWVDDDDGGLPPTRRPELYDASGAPLGEVRAAGVGDPVELPPLELSFTDELADALSALKLDVAAGDEPDLEREGTTGEVQATAPVADEAGEPDRAAPPPAAIGRAAAYPNPSDMLAAAAGRPFDLFGADSGTIVASGVTPTTISVAGIVTETLAGSPYRSDVCLGARARFEQANRHDELNRDVQLSVCHDDSGRTDIAEGLYQSMARDEIFAVVPVGSPAFTVGSGGSELTLPYVGGDPLPSFCGRAHPTGFGVHGARGCPVLEARGFVSLSEPVLTALASSWDPSLEADATIVHAVDTGPGGEAIVSARRFEAELLDLADPTFVAVLPTPAEHHPLDWSPIASAIAEPDPDIVVVEGEVREGLVTALRGLGYGGEIIAVGATDPRDQVRAGVDTVVSLGFDVASHDTPGWLAMVGAARSVGVGEPDIGMDFIEGYLAADFFVQAAAATPEPLTQARLADTVNMGWWYPGVDGLACGSWWPASHLIATPCVSVARGGGDDNGLVPVVGLVSTEPQVRFALGDG